MVEEGHHLARHGVGGDGAARRRRRPDRRGGRGTEPTPRTRPAPTAASRSPSSRPRRSRSTVPRACARLQRPRHTLRDRSRPRRPDESLSIDEGAVKPWGENTRQKTGWSANTASAEQILEQLEGRREQAVAKLSEAPATRDRCSTARASKRSSRSRGRARTARGAISTSTWEGVIPRLMRRFKETKSEGMKRWYSQFIAERRCSTCGGSRGCASRARGASVGARASSRSRP